MTEIWKPVVGYEKYYEVSNIGRVRSLDREMTSPTGKKFIKKGRIRKQNINPKTGYYMLFLNGRDSKRCHSVHRLVAEAFLENPSNLPIVNHKNEIRADNRAENLEWCTHQYNMLYSNVFEKSRKPVVQIDPMTKEEVRWSSARAAHAATGVEYKNISACCRGLRPRAGGYEWRFL